MPLNFEEPIFQETNEVNYLTRVVVGLIDAALSILVVTLIFVYQSPWFLYQLILPVNGTLLVLLCFIIYRFLFLILFNGTIGMKLFKVILLNGQEQQLSLIEKLLFCIFILYRGVDYYEVKNG